MNYRRVKVKGGTYFFTLTLADRNQSLLTDHIAHLRNAFKIVKYNHPFTLDAIVILPDHLHTIWTLPDNDQDYITRISLIKSNFSRQLPKKEEIGFSRVKKRERGIWQRRFWEHWIKNDQDFLNHVDYIHINPVKHGYVKQVKAWHHSSFHQFVKRGILPEYWGSDVMLPSIEVGE